MILKARKLSNKDKLLKRKRKITTTIGIIIGMLLFKSNISKKVFAQGIFLEIENQTYLLFEIKMTFVFLNPTDYPECYFMTY